jgi:hypothetical protein
MERIKCLKFSDTGREAFYKRIFNSVKRSMVDFFDSAKMGMGWEQ